MQTLTHWRDLHVFDAEGCMVETLGSMVDCCPANLDNAQLESEGSIGFWIGYFIATPDENPHADSPEYPVDWTGLKEELGR